MKAYLAILSSRFRYLIQYRAAALAVDGSQLLFGLRGSASVAAGVMFVVSLLGGLLLAASMTALLTISLLWTISGEGISRLAPAPIFFFSGIAIPLPLFPGWLQWFIAVLP